MAYNYGILYPPIDTPKHLPNCGVVAVATVAGATHQEVWNYLSTRFQRRNTWRGRTHDHEVIDALQVFDVQFEEVKVPGKPHVLHEFCSIVDKLDPEAAFIVWTSGHVQTVQGNSVSDQHGIYSIDIAVRKRALVRRVLKILSNNPRKGVDVKSRMSDVIVTNKRSKQMSKIDQAKAIYAANSTKSRKEVIELFVAQLNMSPAAASTYQATCKKWFNALPTSGAAATVTSAPVQSIEVDRVIRRVHQTNSASGPLHSFSTEEIQAEVDTIGEWRPMSFRPLIEQIRLRQGK